MNAYIFEDANGSWWQYLDPEAAQYLTRDGKNMHLGTSQLGGWYDLACNPVDAGAVAMPVKEVWRRDK